MIDDALGVLQHLAGRLLLGVEDLAADRQQRLVLGVAGQLGGAERGVALDDEQLAAVDVVASAVGQLGRQRTGLEGVLAPLGVALLAGGDPGPSGVDDLLHHRAGLRLLAASCWSVRKAPISARHDLRDDPRGRRGAEDLLGLPLELRLGQPDRDDRGHALEHVVLGDIGLAGLHQPRVCRITSLKRLRQRALEAR